MNATPYIFTKLTVNGNSEYLSKQMSTAGRYINKKVKSHKKIIRLAKCHNIALIYRRKMAEEAGAAESFSQTDKTKPKYYVLEMFPYPSGRPYGPCQKLYYGRCVTRYKRVQAAMFAPNGVGRFWYAC